VSPFAQILFRVFVLAVGWLPAGSRLVRRLLLALLRRGGPGGRMTYVAHADFLDTRDLVPGDRAVAVVDPELLRG
jgi:hypothetical protein